MKKNVLVFDWSNMSFRSLFTSQIFGHARSYETKEEVNSFIAKMATDISMILRTFVPHKVIFAVDSSDPWRKDLLSTEEVGYKGQREKDKSINWDNVYSGLQEFRNVLSEKGFEFAYTNRAEADDLMCLCKEMVFKQYPDCNIVIVSSDADIRQLVDFNLEKEQFACVFNPIGTGKGGKKKLYINRDCLEWYSKKDEVDIFFSNMNHGKEFIKTALNRDKKIELVEIDPDQVVLGKIFCGDAGDNVPSFYEYYKSNGKKYKISEKKFENICKELCITDVEDLMTKEMMIKGVLEKVLKKEINDINVPKRLERQRRLVELNSELFPESIQLYITSIFSMLEYDFHNAHINLATVKMTDLLAGSSFFEIVNKRKAKDADIFKDIDKYASQLEPIKLL